MGSGAMIYIPRIIKIGWGIQMLMGGIHRQQGDRISLLFSFQNKESRLKKWYFFQLLGVSLKLEKGRTPRRPNSNRLNPGLYTPLIISVVFSNWKWKISLLPF
jgi:hypothetical protein